MCDLCDKIEKEKFKKEELMAKEKFIQKMHMKKGALHEQLGVPEGKKIPESKLKKAENSKSPLLRKRANLAETLKGLKK